MKITKNSAAAFIFLGLFGCIANASDNSNKSQELIGLWRCTYEQADFVILRRSDGTFSEKRVQIYDSAKPAASVNSVGKWWLKGNRYILEYIKTSHAVWRKAIGKPIKFDIQNIKPSEFTYITPDGGINTENRIGDVSEDAFNRAKVSLPGVKVEK